MTRPHDRIILRIDVTGQPGAELRRRARALGFHRFARTVAGGLAAAGRSTTLRETEVGTPKDLAGAIRSATPGSPLLLRWTRDRVIPLESALALRPHEISVWVTVDHPGEVPAALGALERGADAVVVPVESLDALTDLSRWYLPAGQIRLRWRTVAVERVEPIGLGDRWLLDTVHRLPPDGGFLIGSSADLLFLVVSEAVGSEFSRPRPFRVNAGAPHSYVLRPDGTTRYLSEIEPGEPLLLARPGRTMGAARVGRIKIERRPLVLVEAIEGRRRRTIFLQEAETVRLSGIPGPIPVTELRRGDRIRAVSLPAARHLGAVVEEEVEER